jgi:hypothetical protein
VILTSTERWHNFTIEPVLTAYLWTLAPCTLFLIQAETFCGWRIGGFSVLRIVTFRYEKKRNWVNFGYFYRYSGRNWISTCNGISAAALECYFEGMKTNFFHIFLVYKLHMLRTFWKKKLKIVIRNLVNKWYKIVFPKIRCFFAVSPDWRWTISTHKMHQTVVLHTVWLTLQASFNGGYGEDIFIYLSFKMRYTDFHQSLKTWIQNLSFSRNTYVAL